MVNFNEKFGMDKDRKKLVAGIGNFDIVAIDITIGKKDYEVRAGDTVTKGKIKIANIDVMMADKIVHKYYSTAGAIVTSCQEIVDVINGGKMGKLKETVHIDKVEERMSENKREYITFT